MVETPEGPKTGYVKNMSLTSGFTIYMNDQIHIIKSYLKDKIIPLESVNKKKLYSYVKVFMNGTWIGVTSNAVEIHNHLREWRFKGEIEKTVGLIFKFHEKEYHIRTEGGRTTRPFLTVTNNELNFKPEMLNGIKNWDEFIAKYPYVIEYLDKEEEQNMMLAVFPYDITKAKSIMSKAPLESREDIHIVKFILLCY